jgi:hypothetical protein
MIPNRFCYCLLTCLLSFCGTAAPSSAQTAIAQAVSGCELLRHPSRYNGKIVTVEGKYTAGFERSDLTFGCRGSVGIRVSLSPPDLRKYGFLTEKSTVDALSQLPPGEHPGDNLNARKLRQAPVVVVGLFRCHCDFPTCKDASLDDGSIVVKSMRFNAPLSDVPPSAKLSVPADELARESDHANPARRLEAALRGGLVAFACVNSNEAIPAKNVTRRVGMIISLPATTRLRWGGLCRPIHCRG